MHVIRRTWSLFACVWVLIHFHDPGFYIRTFWCISTSTVKSFIKPATLPIQYCFSALSSIHDISPIALWYLNGNVNRTVGDEIPNFMANLYCGTLFFYCCVLLVLRYTPNYTSAVHIWASETSLDALFIPNQLSVSVPVSINLFCWLPSLPPLHFS